MGFTTLLLNFAASFSATVLGGVLLALLFFWAKEKLFPLPDITGLWYLEMRTVRTSYKPYERMVLRYVALLWREGARVEGTAEKIYEDSSTGKRSFVGSNRTRCTVRGFVQKNYLSKDHVFLHVVENGPRRQSTNFYAIQIESKDVMRGSFTSMIADQGGDVVWRRQPFREP